MINQKVAWDTQQRWDSWSDGWARMLQSAYALSHTSGIWLPGRSQRRLFKYDNFYWCLFLCVRFPYKIQPHKRTLLTTRSSSLHFNTPLLTAIWYVSSIFLLFLKYTCILDISSICITFSELPVNKESTSPPGWKHINKTINILDKRDGVELLLNFIVLL